MGVLHLCLGNYARPTDIPNNQKADMRVNKEVTIPIIASAVGIAKFVYVASFCYKDTLF